MTEQDWITLYQQSLPVIEGHRGSAITTSVTVIALCIFISLFVFSLMKKRKLPMNALNLLLIASPIILSAGSLGTSFANHFKDPYAITAKIEKKWISGRYDIPMLGITAESAVHYSKTGKGTDLPEKKGYLDIMATKEIYEYLEEGEELILLSMGNNQVFGRIKGEKLLVPLPKKEENH